MAQKSSKTTTEKVKAKAADMAETKRDDVTACAKSGAKNVRDTAAYETQKVADAAEAAAVEFDSESVQAKAVEEVARRIEDIATQVRGTDIDRVAHSVSEAARRNPMLFVAGAALAGFAATRFLKARDPKPTGLRGQDNPWEDQGDTFETSRSGPYAGSSDGSTAGQVS